MGFYGYVLCLLYVKLYVLKNGRVRLRTGNRLFCPGCWLPLSQRAERENEYNMYYSDPAFGELVHVWQRSFGVVGVRTMI